MLQSLNELLNRRLHVIAQPLRTDIGSDQHRQPEAIACIVDIQGQRVIGVVLGVEGLDPLPGGFVLRRHPGLRHVPIVEQRAEQGCRCSDTAAALGKHQRRMFMAQQGGQLLVSCF